jgi:2-dehydro-3-deoxyphosphooctonate aldolase (KDO 8-P synthase)
MILIAGPCVIESDELLDIVASFMKNALTAYGDRIDYYFKASFDKANRSAYDSFRGPGLKQGLKSLERVKSKFGLKVLTDVHEVSQCEAAAEVVDAIQVPAFLCRQTDLIFAAAKSAKKYNKKLNVKKGQFLAPWDVVNIIEKVEVATDSKKPSWLWLTERGTSFGYNNLVVDMTAFPIMRSFGVPVIFDTTHSVQLPGGGLGGKVTGGRREFIRPLTRAAMAVGVDGLFMEVHPEPDKAKSDAANAFYLNQVPLLLKEIFAIRDVLNKINEEK